MQSSTLANPTQKIRPVQSPASGVISNSAKKKPRNFRFEEKSADGDPPGNRTPDTLLKRQVLYRLS